jgi:UPF0716 protein FxsA
MPLLLILMFPLAEIAAFIIVGREIGVVLTLALIVASSAVGLSLLRNASALTLLRLQRRQGNPSAVIAEGGAQVLAGLLLVIPGFLTDIAAIAVLLPSVRRFVLGLIGARAIVPAGIRPSSGPVNPTVIDGDFRRLDRE